VLNTLLSKTIFEHKMCWTHYWAWSVLSQQFVCTSNVLCLASDSRRH